MPETTIDKDATWTTRRLLGWMGDHFKERGIESPRLVGELLLSHVLGCDRMRLYMEADREATPAERQTLRDLVARAARNEPVQYLIGLWRFYGRDFEVDASTLIPRPCTEQVVEQVLAWAGKRPGGARPAIADIGTGTGCIAVTLAAQLPDAEVIATDVVPEALQLAERNATRNNVTIELLEGPALEPLRAGDRPRRVDVICSNPPYISDVAWAEVPPNVKDYEPASALRGGPDGLAVIRPLIESAPAHLAPGGRLVVEIASSLRENVLEIAASVPRLGEPRVLEDHEGLWRVFVADVPSD